MVEAAINLYLQPASGSHEPRTLAVIDKRLWEWADWQAHGGSPVSGLGYGNSMLGAAVDNGGMVIRATASGASLTMPERIYDTERAVALLPPELKRVITEHYLHADASEAIRLRRCQCSRRTYYRRLARAHQQVAFGGKWVG